MSVENTVEAAHALLGASNAHRWTVCKRYPIFVQELQKSGIIPLQTSNQYAAQGTVAHAVAAEHVNCNVKTVCGQVVQQDGFDIEVTDEMLDAVMVHVAYMRSHMKPGRRVRVEQKLQIPEQNKRSNYEVVGPLWGTTDGEIVAPFSYLEIVDYKHGSGKFVDVENNTQLKYYAAASYLSLPADVQAEIPVIKTTIIQPRHYLAANTGGIWSTSYKPEEIISFAQEIVSHASQVSADAPLTPGAHCEWCPAAMHCPARLQHHSDKLGFMLAKADTQEKTPPPLPIEALSEQQILAIVENADLIRDYLDAAEEHVRGKLMTGADVPGWALKTNYGHRKWVNDAQCAEVFKQVLGDSAFTAPKLKTPPEMEKALKAAGIEAQNFDQLVSRKVSSYALVRQKDLKPNDEVFSIANMAKSADKIELVKS